MNGEVANRTEIENYKQHIASATKDQEQADQQLFTDV